MAKAVKSFKVNQVGTASLVTTTIYECPAGTTAKVLITAFTLVAKNLSHVDGLASLNVGDHKYEAISDPSNTILSRTNTRTYKQISDIDTTSSTEADATTAITALAEQNSSEYIYLTAGETISVSLRVTTSSVKATIVVLEA